MIHECDKTLFAFLQLPLHSFLFSDVASDRRGADNFARQVINRGKSQANLNFLPVFSPGDSRIMSESLPLALLARTSLVLSWRLVGTEIEMCWPTTSASV